MTCCGQLEVGIESSGSIPNEFKEKMGRGSVIVRHCDVCYLLDNDASPKETMYCSLCDAFMCDACRRNKWRRMGAAIARKVKKVWQPVA